MQVDEGQMVLGGFSVRRRGGAAIATLPSAAVEWAMTSQKGRSKGSLEEREREREHSQFPSQCIGTYWLYLGGSWRRSWLPIKFQGVWEYRTQMC